MIRIIRAIRIFKKSTTNTSTITNENTFVLFVQFVFVKK